MLLSMTALYHYSVVTRKEIEIDAACLVYIYCGLNQQTTTTCGPQAKHVGARWMIDYYNYLNATLEIIVNGFRHVGILDILNK